MCIGESHHDTIGEAECGSLRTAAAEGFPLHRFGVHSNAEGQIWVVLEPMARRADLLRFTICRIAPCVMVLVEDAAGRRQICSAANVENAIAYARNAADQAMLASANAHPAHTIMQ